MTNPVRRLVEAARAICRADYDTETYDYIVSMKDMAELEEALASLPPDLGEMVLVPRTLLESLEQYVCPNMGRSEQLLADQIHAVLNPETP